MRVIRRTSDTSVHKAAVCQPHNNGMQRTVRHKVPRHMPQRAAADAERYTQP
jgi:hypothetical protein